MFLKAIEAGDEAFLSAAPWNNRKGADLNCADGTGATAVHFCMRHNAEKFLKPLIQRGAFVEFPDRDGARPITYAIRENNAAAVRMLLALKDRTSKLIIDRNQIVMTPNANTLLHEAAWYDRTEIVAILLADVKADGTKSFEAEKQLEIFNKGGMTPLHVAAFRACPELSQLLITAGAKMDTMTNNPSVVRESAMDIAVTDGKTATADLFAALAVTTNSVMFAAKMKKKVAAK